MTYILKNVYVSIAISLSFIGAAFLILSPELSGYNDFVERRHFGVFVVFVLTFFSVLAFPHILSILNQFTKK